MACETTALLEDAKCIIKCIPPGMMPAVSLVALCNIADAGGGGTIQVYQGRSPAAPDDPTKAALDYPVGGGTLLQWDIGSASWV